MKIELAVGTEVIINGITYMVKDQQKYLSKCLRCAFCSFESEECNQLACLPEHRKDRNSVIFVKSNTKADEKE